MGRLADILALRGEAEHSVSTLPALMMAAEKISATVMSGLHAQRKAGSGEKFWQFRDYHTTDQPQDIDWRQSAKTDRVFIKEKEWQTTQRTYLWCATGASMHFTSDRKRYSKREVAQILTLSLALLLRQSEEQVGLFGDIKTGRSEEKMQKIGQNLFEDSDAGDTGSLPPSMHFSLPRHASFVGISDFLSSVEDIAHSFMPIAPSAQNALIIQVLDPAEIDLTYQGRVRFRGLDEGEVEVIDHVASVRQDYTRRMEAHIAQVKALCHEQHWSYILHRTDHDIGDTLRDIWLMMTQNGARK